ncbi:hypothetical protein TPHA_0J02750 [Tetrapisispora phaffii CBS 4417]|uniref:Rho-GAP domain-containing protein n=1 Tax=Tetrapisispora phaffii (strain ATCC 24235 / CBS 4417 / NBRC 1672 / NRRL Y-8282 / UCD 70-5) TaxID=1071381 RepID=G8BZ04_TETPH|nr:hypothetical protein TPHA_0J02750 [Tetrapisispora phaffii CBS 4417]CCE65096.1 hypothetical protein TPHA_0J02750 [Tetrapisispora phaffii CBS 4417]
MFWKNFTNNPKSHSTDLLTVSNDKKIDEDGNKLKVPRPSLNAKGHSFSTNSKRLSSFLGYGSSSSNVHTESNSVSSMNEQDYKEYRDKFLLNRHGFDGTVFGVPLKKSLDIANTEIMIQNSNNGDPTMDSTISRFGRIPIVVAKTGSYLKNNALDTCGIFRITGNNKKVKQLQYIFSIEETNYGMKFSDWDNYSVHDFTALLRRFLNNLNEPLIPLEFYNDFRKPLRSRPRILKHLSKEIVQHPNSLNDNKLEIQASNNESIKENKGTTDDITKPDELSQKEAAKKKKDRRLHKKRLAKDIRDAIKEYQKLFLSLNPDSKHLTLYLLDMLSLFDRNSDKNLMTTQNLSAIFQPSILSHPEHDMDPKQYELSRLILEFLIEYSYKLVPFMLQQGPEDTTNSEWKNTSGLTKFLDSNLNMPAQALSDKSNEKKNNADNNFKPPLSVLVTEANDKSDEISVCSNNKKEGSAMSSPIASQITTQKTTIQFSPTKGKKESSPLSASFKASDEVTLKLPFNKEPVSSGIQKKQLETHKKTRPHARSIGSTSVPHDIIPSKQNNKNPRFFSWLQKSSLLSDSGEFSVTEEEGEEDDEFDGNTSYEDANSSIISNMLPSPLESSHNARKETSRKTSSGSFQLRPKSMFINNKSSDELSRNLQAVPLSTRSSSYTGVLKMPLTTASNMKSISPSTEIPTIKVNEAPNINKIVKKEKDELRETDNHLREIKENFSETREARTKKRQSWFQRLRSSSKSTTRS